MLGKGRMEKNMIGKKGYNTIGKNRIDYQRLKMFYTVSSMSMNSRSPSDP